MLLYAIAATPRTGSTYLCSLLYEAGFGEPDEWLHAGRPRTWKTIDELHSLRTVNDVFGVKLFWLHRDDKAIVDFDDVVPASGKWIYLSRRDTYSQARSYETAIAREEWADVHVPYLEVDPKVLSVTQARLERYCADWNAWFRRKKIRPFRISYEYMVANPERAVARISTFLSAT